MCVYMWVFHCVYIHFCIHISPNMSVSLHACPCIGADSGANEGQSEKRKEKNNDKILVLERPKAVAPPPPPGAEGPRSILASRVAKALTLFT